MKKFLIGLLTIFALAMTVGLVTACSKAEQLITLDQPVIKEYDPDTTRLTWGVVENASSYTVTFTDGGDINKNAYVKRGEIPAEDIFENMKGMFGCSSWKLDINGPAYTPVRPVYNDIVLYAVYE